MSKFLSGELIGYMAINVFGNLIYALVDPFAKIFAKNRDIKQSETLIVREKATTRQVSLVEKKEAIYSFTLCHSLIVKPVHINISLKEALQFYKNDCTLCDQCSRIPISTRNYCVHHYKCLEVICKTLSDPSYTNLFEEKREIDLAVYHGYGQFNPECAYS
jgi:hypothetical protein